MKRYVLSLFLSLSFPTFLAASQPHQDIDMNALIQNFNEATFEYQQTNATLKYGKKNQSQTVIYTTDIARLEILERTVKEQRTIASELGNILTAAIAIQNMQKNSQDQNLNNQKKPYIEQFNR